MPSFRKLPWLPCLAPTHVSCRSLQVTQKEREQPDHNTVGSEQPPWQPPPTPPGNVIPVATLPWPGDHQPPRPTPFTLFLFFLSCVLSFPFFPFLFARETQSPHDSVSPSLLNLICTKSFALVWSLGSGLEFPSVCASKLLSAPGLLWPAAPGTHLPSISVWGCPGAAERVRPHPPLA